MVKPKVRYGVQVVVVTRFQQNCMVVAAEGSDRAVIVDPGGDVPLVLSAAAERNLRVDGILITHGHIDHIGGLQEIALATHAPVWYHPDDLRLYEHGAFGSPPVKLPDDAVAVADGDRIEAAGLGFTVLHTPGHTPGSVSFYTESLGRPHLFDGDLLFAAGIGRTDFPRGDYNQLVESISRKVWPLPDDTRVMPGHGPATTVEVEKAHNPFVAVGLR